ncbi:TPA: hypothetical protein I7183_23050 [Vibrio vulnificus]|nr:hypothetical protein [Vibrio vulnificus]
MTSEVFTDKFYLIHESGDHLYPCRIKNRDTGKVSFRVSKGGKNGNTKAIGQEVECELEVESLVLEHGYAVRAKTKDKTRNGLYKLNQRSILKAVKN